MRKWLCGERRGAVPVYAFYLNLPAKLRSINFLLHRSENQCIIYTDLDENYLA
jgi:hypothetical protein